MFRASASPNQNSKNSIDYLNNEKQKDLLSLLQPIPSETYLNPLKDDLISLSLHKTKVKQKNFIQTADLIKGNPANDFWKLKDTENYAYSPKTETYRPSPFIPDFLKNVNSGIPSFIKEIMDGPSKTIHNHNHTKKKDSIDNSIGGILTICDQSTKNLKLIENTKKIENNNSKKSNFELLGNQKSPKNDHFHLGNSIKKSEILLQSITSTPDSSQKLLKLPLIQKSPQKDTIHYDSKDTKTLKKSRISCIIKRINTDKSQEIPLSYSPKRNKSEFIPSIITTRISTLNESHTNEHTKPNSKSQFKNSNRKITFGDIIEEKTLENQQKIKKNQRIVSFNLFRPRTINKFHMFTKNINEDLIKQEKKGQTPDKTYFLQDLLGPFH